MPADHAGMGLRGTVATCVEADPVWVPASNRLWSDELAFSLGLMHLGGGDPPTRADLVRLRTDSVHVLCNDILSAVTCIRNGRPTGSGCSR
ncbi:hypothetical protein [Lentzea nigeriaca]|uniref:hypothetical protein n=1 Tax=Lentzea nigeriaca TaxID=1128665 RepID=UPI00195E77A9|nr:hypothetical protein [Lentzea nigeriaca]MBM7864160.1 hypothetical protein [Lentzea nigeriaca]